LVSVLLLVFVLEHDYGLGAGAGGANSYRCGGRPRDFERPARSAAFFAAMFGQAAGGKGQSKPGGSDAFFDSLKHVIKLVQSAYRKSNHDDWNFALLMKWDADRSMCPQSIAAIHALTRAPLFEHALTVKSSLDDIKSFQQRTSNATPVETQAFCMLCARALFEHHRFFDALEFTYQALKLFLTDASCVFPRWTRPVFDAIAGNFKTLWALCKVTQVSAFAEDVDTVREGTPDQLVEINAEVQRVTRDNCCAALVFPRARTALILAADISPDIG